MIPLKEERDVHSQGVTDSTSFEISDADASHIMTILRDTLYSDKIMAVLREYSANGWDAMQTAGKGHLPIKVTLPTYGDPTLVIRDFGSGLSHEEVGRIFTKYGASSKRGDNAAVGMLGIGSKSGFAYSDSFTVTSWNGGKERMYVAVIDASEKGRMDLLLEKELPCACGKSVHSLKHSLGPKCSEPETGLEIKIPVKSSDIPTFVERAKRLYKYFSPQPTINTQIPPPDDGNPIEELLPYGRVLKFDPASHWNRPNGGQWLALMGPIAYRIDFNQLEKDDIGSIALVTSGVLYFEIGQLAVAASREDLKYSDATKVAITERLTAITDKYLEKLLEGIDQLDDWHRRLRIIEINRIGISMSSRGYNDYNSLSVSLAPRVTVKADPTAVPPVYAQYAFWSATKSYSGKLDANAYVRVEPNSRIVIRDDNRTIKGFQLQNTDLLVTASKDLDKALLPLEVKKSLAEAKLTGIPVVKLSSVSFLATGSARPRDNERAKATSFLIVEPTTLKYYNEDQLSKNWNPIARVPTDDDVYAVLKAYRWYDVPSPYSGDVYQTYRTDWNLLTKLGLKMPPLVGYKDTEAKPIDVRKLKGTSYWNWRQTKMISLILSVKTVATLWNHFMWTTTNSLYVTPARVAKELGDDHIISKVVTMKTYAEAVCSKKRYNSTDYDAVSTVYNLVKTTKVEATKLSGIDTSLASVTMAELRSAYPLLMHYGLQVLGRDDEASHLWFDHIRLTDSHKKAKK